MVKCLQASSARVRWKQQRCCSPARLTDQIRADSAGEKRQRGSKEGAEGGGKEGQKEMEGIGEDGKSLFTHAEKVEGDEVALLGLV